MNIPVFTPGLFAVLDHSALPGYGAEIPATLFWGQERKKKTVVTQEMMVKRMESFRTPGIFSFNFFVIDAPSWLEKKETVLRVMDFIPCPIFFSLFLHLFNLYLLLLLPSLLYCKFLIITISGTRRTGKMQGFLLATS